MPVLGLDRQPQLKGHAVSYSEDYVAHPLDRSSFQPLFGYNNVR